MIFGKKTLGLVAMLAAGALAPASGAIIYDTSAQGELVGSRSESGGGIVTGGGWVGVPPDNTLSWNISFNAGTQLWSYEYTFTNFPGPGSISHFILDLSANCLSPADNCVIDGGSPVEYNTFGVHPSNPGFPAGSSIQGIKFDFGSDTATAVYSFDSERAPVYGDFYVKGGSTSFAYNAGLANHLSENVNWFIARPDTTGGQVPEPVTLGLVGTGLMSMFFLRKRAARKA